jgi:Ran GTPase-activating protein (RanGAP) involved in mRNA processing and transport
MVLNLSKNYLGNYSAARLKEFLVGDNTLVELYLHWAELGPKATKLIFEGLAKNNGLKVLDISWNQVGLDGIRPFCNCTSLLTQS